MATLLLCHAIPLIIHSFTQVLCVVYDYDLFIIHSIRGFRFVVRRSCVSFCDFAFLPNIYV